MDDMMQYSDYSTSDSDVDNDVKLNNSAIPSLCIRMNLSNSFSDDNCLQLKCVRSE